MASLQELLAQKAALEAKIVEVQAGARAEAIAKNRATMAEFGLTVAGLGNTKAPRAASKVVAMYRNDATGETRSGREPKPKWLVSALAAGATL